MEEGKIKVHRIVPNIYTDDMEASMVFYQYFLALEPVMDMGWIMTFASRENPKVQINIFKNEKEERPDQTGIFLSVEVSDVDTMYARAGELSYPVIYDIRDEPWGVRRFFVKSPEGATINLLTHLKK